MNHIYILGYYKTHRVNIVAFSTLEEAKAVYPDDEWMVQVDGYRRTWILEGNIELDFAGKTAYIEEVRFNG